MSANFNVLLDVITRRREPSFIPMYEHAVDDPVIEQIMGYDFSKIDKSSLDGKLDYLKKKITFYQQMGFDCFPFEITPRFAEYRQLKTDDTAVYSAGQRSWMDEHNGVIQTMEDVENPEYWPETDVAFDFELFERVCSMMPEGMKVIGGASGGPFEHASFLMGLEGLCIATYEDEELVEKLCEKIGRSITGIAERLARIENLGAYRFGDDLGFKSSTMLPPDKLRKYFFPWSRKVVEAVHKAGKPFVLHSCGQLREVMDDLIDDVKIDAKHSFEDVIMPVTEAKKIWGERVALLGGIDVDFLCRRSTQEIKEHTKRVMEECSKGGGYAIGSGNTITNYMPAKNYLAMVDAVREFNR